MEEFKKIYKINDGVCCEQKKIKLIKRENFCSTCIIWMDQCRGARNDEWKEK